MDVCLKGFAGWPGTLPFTYVRLMVSPQDGFMLCMLSKKNSDDILISPLFSQEIRFDIPSKCLKCQSLFQVKNKKILQNVVC